MNEEKKLKQFVKLIDKAYLQVKVYEKIMHQMLAARELMMKHDKFARSSAKVQYDMCVTIVLIATHSTHAVVHNTRILSRPEPKEFEYDLNKNYAVPFVIEINEGLKVLSESKHD